MSVPSARSDQNARAARLPTVREAKRTLPSSRVPTDALTKKEKSTEREGAIQPVPTAETNSSSLGIAPEEVTTSIEHFHSPTDIGTDDRTPEPNNDELTLTPELLELRTIVRRAIAHYQTRQLNTRDHDPWEMMHAFVAFNIGTVIRRDGPQGPPVNAIAWILEGGRCRGRQILTLRGGRPHAEEGVGVQGHPAQLLAILAQSRVSRETPMRIGGKNFTLQDLIDEEKLDCRTGTELTFKLISLAHYLPSDETWQSRAGQQWSISRLLNEEIKAPIRGAACGGTHRLFGISYAYHVRQKEGRPLDGEFLRAKQYISSYHRYAYSLQNPDGSFSTEWFARRGNRPDLDRKIQTTGHILEWLVFSLSEEELLDPRAAKAADFLATALLREPNRPWSIGPLGHALHALVMYDERLFQRAVEPPPALAKD
jgi:hypothetical protein